MPRAGPVEPSRYKLLNELDRIFQDATGWPRGVFTLQATQRVRQRDRLKFIRPSFVDWI